MASPRERERLMMVQEKRDCKPLLCPCPILQIPFLPLLSHLPLPLGHHPLLHPWFHLLSGLHLLLAQFSACPMLGQPSSWPIIGKHVTQAHHSGTVKTANNGAEIGWWYCLARRLQHIYERQRQCLEVVRWQSTGRQQCCNGRRWRQTVSG